MPFEKFMDAPLSHQLIVNAPYWCINNRYSVIQSRTTPKARR